MKKENATCIQRVKIVFPLCSDKKGKRLRINNSINKIEKISDRTITNSFTLLNRNNQINILLQNIHDDWFVYRTNKKLVMETTAFDFCEVIKMLSDNGFSDTDYILEVEYERKWGML